MTYTINEIKEIIIPIAKMHGVKKICLFGSYAKETATEKSDIDFYIDKGKITDLIKYFELVNDLEEKLGCHVDIITTEIEDKNFFKQNSKRRHSAI